MDTRKPASQPDGSALAWLRSRFGFHPLDIEDLTIISTIMLPLAVISGIYGMNIAGLPFAGHPWAAVFAAVLMIVVASTLALFKLRRWI